jgi:hypothetical protein
MHHLRFLSSSSENFNFLKPSTHLGKQFPNPKPIQRDVTNGISANEQKKKILWNLGQSFCRNAMTLLNK